MNKYLLVIDPVSVTWKKANGALQSDGHYSDRLILQGKEHTDLSAALSKFECRLSEVLLSILTKRTLAWIRPHQSHQSWSAYQQPAMTLKRVMANNMPQTPRYIPICGFGCRSLASTHHCTHIATKRSVSTILPYCERELKHERTAKVGGESLGYREYSKENERDVSSVSQIVQVYTPATRLSGLVDLFDRYHGRGNFGCLEVFCVHWLIESSARGSRLLVFRSLAASSGFRSRIASYEPVSATLPSSMTKMLSARESISSVFHQLYPSKEMCYMS